MQLKKKRDNKSTSSIPENIKDILENLDNKDENSDYETESETESGTKKTNKTKIKKLNKTQEAREIAKKLPPLTQDKLTEVIGKLDEKIEKIGKYKDKEKIAKKYADILNAEFGKYGIVKEFRTGTSIKTVKKKLEALKVIMKYNNQRIK